MANIGFIGLGNMGGPMAHNLRRAGHLVRGFDIAPEAATRAAAGGVRPSDSIADASAATEVVVTMLPAGPETRDAYLGAGGILANATPGTLLIDSSTIDVATARILHDEAAARGFAMVDAPVSGGVAGAAAGTLTFMIGGSDAAVARARPVLSAMGKTIVHAGGPGTGQAAKMCNNLILGVSIIAVAEAFTLAEAVGLDAARMFEIVAASSGQCWSLTSYCPVPGLVPTSPANRDFAAGFTAAMMLKDLRLAERAADDTGRVAPLAAAAATLYQRFCDHGEAGTDFSGIIRMIGAARP
ncbi:MAG: 3-hydroxyisobutyrate dehydrogenase [Alphaproteobacteria bacterium]|nr:3-hydroxyisobutyrate dehydrogenase [Alphaproteobacteria bacterium]